MRAMQEELSAHETVEHSGDGKQLAAELEKQKAELEKHKSELAKLAKQVCCPLFVSECETPLHPRFYYCCTSLMLSERETG